MKRLIIHITFVCIAFTVVGQDIHFSQFYNSPLTLNPALTGLTKTGDLRAGALYRNQWSSISNPFQTLSAYFDIPIYKGFGANDAIAPGIAIFHDKSGTVNLSNLSVLLSFAYHKSLGLDNRFALSLGVQGGFTQKRIDMTDAIFGDQIDGSLSVGSGGSSDAQNVDNFSYFDLNVGLGFSAKLTNNSKMYLGGAVHHLTQPDDNYLKNSIETEALSMRFVAQASFEVKMTDKLALLPSAVYMYQASTYEVNLGTGLQHKLKNEFSMIYGAYYRVKDAFIPVLGIAYKSAELSVSYDVNISDLTVATNTRGGFELSFVYQNVSKKPPYEHSIFFCPRF